MTHSSQRAPGSRTLAVAACVLAVTAITCGSLSPELAIETGIVGADLLLFERGTAALEERDWTRARQYFVEIRDNYPQSQHRAEARLLIGDTYEGEGTLEGYVQALDEYQDFLSLFPTHPRAPYAQYKVGMVHLQQMRRAERDQTETMNAVLEFETFITRYPTDQELMTEVRQRLREARDRLSEHDFVVGRFYHRSENYPGAINRFRLILDNDPGYSRRDEVYFHLGEALAQSRQLTEAIPYFARILDEFDTSEYAEEARIRITELETGEVR